MRHCVCVSSAVVVWPVLSLFSLSPQQPPQHPALFPRCPRCWRVLARCSVPYGGCPSAARLVWLASGFSQRHVPSVPSLLVRPLFRWLSPPPLACCRWSSLSSSEGGCVGFQHLFPPLLSPCYVFFRFGLAVVRFGSVFIL
ncbi:hypothetical protein GQ42DRAFT_160263, partial [Ramicandelaber brevisporus]